MVIFSTMRISLSSLLVLFLFFILMSSPAVYAGLRNGRGGGEGKVCLQKYGECNKAAALRLKVIAMVSILATSLISVCLPLFSTSVPALGPDHNLFMITKVLGLRHHPRRWFHACVAGLIRCAKVKVPTEDTVAQVPLLRLRCHGVGDSEAHGGLHCHQSLQQTRDEARGVLPVQMGTSMFMVLDIMGCLLPSWTLSITKCCSIIESLP